MSPSPSARRGTTLVEMLIVLAILALAVGVTWPVLRSPWRRSQVEDAANHARVVLAKVRGQAIESGTAWQFRYLPGTGLYEYEPIAPRGDSPEARPLAASKESLKEARVEDELPHEVFFDDPHARESFDSLDSSEATPLAPDEISQRDAADWSKPIVFYPNGRATSARLTLHGTKGLSVDVTLRGLTGMARVGKLRHPRREEESPE